MPPGHLTFIEVKCQGLFFALEGKARVYQVTRWREPLCPLFMSLHAFSRNRFGFSEVQTKTLSGLNAVLLVLDLPKYLVFFSLHITISGIGCMRFCTGQKASGNNNKSGLVQASSCF